MGRLDGKVAVITGAGRGLGRSHALTFAREGAAGLVINDPGVTRAGTEGDEPVAESVCREVEQLGTVCKAVPNRDSVADPEGAERIIKAALDAFGRIDILVNNAGILRDKMLHNMDDEMWRAVLETHLSGTFYCTRAAVRVMRPVGYGRIINTTSLAGLQGNPGQANYSAAKGGIASLTRTASMELKGRGITVNVIAPLAKTRLTEDIAAVPEAFTPEDASPMVAFLASDDAAHITGQIFGIHGRQIFEYRMMTSDGVTLDHEWTLDEIAGRIDEIMFTKKKEEAAAG